MSAYDKYRDEIKDELEKNIDLCENDIKIFNAIKTFSPMDYYDYNNIRKSELYKIVKEIPKITSSSFHIYSAIPVLQFITYLRTEKKEIFKKLYINLGCIPTEKYSLIFLNSTEKRVKDCWYNLEHVGDIKNEVYEKLEKKLNFIRTVKKSPDEYIWNLFDNYIEKTTFVFRSEETFPLYIDQVLQKYYDDKIYYIEMRGNFDSIYKLLELPDLHFFNFDLIEDSEVEKLAKTFVNKYDYLKKNIEDKDYKHIIGLFKRILYQCKIINERLNYLTKIRILK